MLKLSIITINRNNAEGLRKTMESVFAQTYQDFEYIVVDGASTDGSVEVIKELESTIKQRATVDKSNIAFQWISEPDTGIYNAMNKGIKMSGGEYLLFLNSGDWLCTPTVLTQVSPFLRGYDIVHGFVYMGQISPQNAERGVGGSELTFRDVYEGNLWHQASFFNFRVFKQYGLYEEDWKIAGDTAYYLRVLGLGEASFLYVNIAIAVQELGGMSSRSNDALRELAQEEENRFKQQIPSRILKMCEQEEKKVKLYDRLHTNKFIWYCTLILSWLAKRNK